MTDNLWERDEIESPCQKICVIHPDARICIGCSRTADEITRWSRMTSDERRKIMSELQARSGLLAKRRGGRRVRSKNNP